MNPMRLGQIKLTLEAVKHVVSAQFPQWKSMAVKAVDSDGTVNALFRLGDKIVLRFPLLPDSTNQFYAELEEHVNFLKRIQNQLPLKVPTPITLGEPSE